MTNILVWDYAYARLAQSVEHQTLNLRVVGSSPTLGVLLRPLGVTVCNDADTELASNLKRLHKTLCRKKISYGLSYSLKSLIVAAQ